MAGRGTRWGALAGAVLVVVFAAALLRAPDTLAAQVAGRWGQGAAEALAALACVHCARRLRGRARAAWLLFGAAQGIWAVTDLAAGAGLLWGVDPASPSLFDALWLTFYLPMGAGILLTYRRLRPERGWQGVLDGALLAGATALIAWMALFHEAVARSSGGGAGLVVNLVYPVADLVALSAIGWVLLRLGVAAPGWLAALAGAVALTLVADVWYLTAYLYGSPAHAGLAAAGYMGASGAWILAARLRARTGQPVWPETARSRPPAWSRALPLVFAVGAVALVTPQERVQFVMALSLAALAGLRIVMTARVEQRLLDERDALLVVDPLTGAGNRRHLEAELARLRAPAAPPVTPLAVLALDVDHLKEVNDLLGHAAGDDLLVRVARATRGCLRAGDTCVRTGGDEFTVLLPGATCAQAVTVAERILRAVTAAGAGCSIGVTWAPPPLVDPQALLRRADRALYRAKAAGRRRVAVDAPDPPLPVG